MMNFYTSMIFFGVILMLVAMAWVLLDGKRSKNYAGQLEEKSRALEEIIADAEQMIIELNKFSDYVAEQVSQKSDEFEKKLNEFEKKLSSFKELPSESKKEQIPSVSETVQCTSTDGISEEIRERIFPSTSQETADSMMQLKKEEKVVPLGNKYREVLALSQKGYTQTDIAKKLKMGKGEIQLIIEMNR